MTLDPTRTHLVKRPDPRTAAAPEAHTYDTAEGPLPFALYRPQDAAPSAPRGAVLFVSGYPDPGMRKLLGQPLGAWASYVDWARLVAETGLVGITYENRTPEDVHALVAHLRAHASALGLRADRLGVWGCSGNGPTALSVLAREHLAAGALLYPFLLDLDGDHTLRDAAAAMYFAPPTVTFADLPDVPLLIVRAGADATPGLDASLGRFLAYAEPRRAALRLLDHENAPHAFDLVDDTDGSRAVIARVLTHLADALG